MESVIEILKKKYLGKYFKQVIYDKPIYQEESVYVKKSNNVTNKQFNSGNPKFRMLSTKRKEIGRDVKIEYLEIVDIIWESNDEYRNPSYSIALVLENQIKVLLDPYNENNIKSTR